MLAFFEKEKRISQNSAEEEQEEELLRTPL
jgi:hypothetical protein